MGAHSPDLYASSTTPSSRSPSPTPTSNLGYLVAIALGQPHWWVVPEQSGRTAKVMSTSVGLIGVGLMGQGIAKNLLQHGFPLTLLDHPGNQPTDQLTAAGAHLVDSPAAVAARAEVIILVVTGAPEVEEILLGARGVLAALRPGATVIDCSTSTPETTE